MNRKFQENTTFYSNSPKSLFSQQRTMMSRNHSTKGFQEDANQFETVIEQQRKKYKENKLKGEQDTQLEKKARIELQGRLLKLKGELSSKDKTKAEMQYKMSSLLNDMTDIKLQNERLRRDLQSARQAYTHKLSELQSQLTHEDQQHREISQRYNDEFEKFKKEGQLYIQTMTFEYDRKVRNLEDRLRVSENSKKEVGAEGKRLHDMMVDQQLSYEEEIRSAVSRVREDEARKYTANLKNLEQKLRGSEEIRQTLSRRNQDLLRIIQQKEHQLTTLGIQKTEQASRNQQEIADYRDRLQQFKLLLDKSSAQLSKKDQELSRLNNDYNPDSTLLKQQFEAKKREVEGLTQTISQLRQAMKQMNSENQRKRGELIQRSNFFESQYKRYKSENTSIWQSVKLKVNDTITQASRV